MPPLLAAVTAISDTAGTLVDLTGVEELRIKAPMGVTRVATGLGPPRVEISYPGAGVLSVGVTSPLTLGGTATAPVIGAPASVASAASNIVLRGTAMEINAGVATLDGLVVGGTPSTFASTIGLVSFADTYATSMTLRGKDGARHEVVLTGNVTFLAPTFYSACSSLEIFITQAGGGGKTATWNAGTGGFFFPVGLSGTLLATTAGDCDYFEFKQRLGGVQHWVCVTHLKYSPP